MMSYIYDDEVLTSVLSFFFLSALVPLSYAV